MYTTYMLCARRIIMKTTLKKLWEEYLSDECAMIKTEEEKELIKKASQMRESLNALLTKEQLDAMQKYVEALYDSEYYVIREAFFKGCEFTASFLFEALNHEERSGRSTLPEV